MNQKDLLKYVAEKTGATEKDLKPVIDAIFDIVKDELIKDGKVKIRNFGKLFLRERKARTVLNPQNQEPIRVAAKKTVIFEK